jgi:hypothetical protein
MAEADAELVRLLPQRAHRAFHLLADLRDRRFGAGVLPQLHMQRLVQGTRFATFFAAGDTFIVGEAD